MENSSDPRFVGICAKCGKKVVERGCKAMEQLFHSQCFTCTKCKKELSGKPFYSMDGKPYCEEDYLSMLEKCAVCERPILDKILRALDKSYHPSCFTCVTCGQCLDGVPFTSDKSNKVYCIKDYQRKYAPQCWGCKKLIVPDSGREEVKRILAMGHNYHPNCYRCEDCGLQLSSQKEGHECYPLDSQALCFKCHTQRRRLHAPGSTAR